MRRSSILELVFAFYFLIVRSTYSQSEGLGQWFSDQNSVDWKGPWFPYAPGGNDNNPTIEYRKKNLYDPHHGIVMGVSDRSCDDGKSYLEIDWDLNPINFTCFSRSSIRPRIDIQALHSQEPIPEFYSAAHKCMDEPIEYENPVPTFGPHRPLWAKFGEYAFLPPQRWLHDLEHGAIVMLYHPCADKNEVNLLKTVVKTCLYRHIITPHNLLTEERPLALVSWGHRLEMSKVVPEIAIEFIKQHALNGPEKLSRDGQYNFLLEQHAEIVTDIDDSQLCKPYSYIQ